jgi:hypothetical protein
VKAYVEAQMKVDYATGRRWKRGRERLLYTGTPPD